jgi:drug/metabolite transporter (DMT)-like permease
MISYNINSDFSVDIGGIFFVAFSFLWAYFSRKQRKFNRSKNTTTTKNRSKSDALSSDVSMFFVFVLNQFLLLFFLYVFVKTAWHLPIRAQYPEIFQYVALGVGGYMGGISMWIFDLSRTLLKESNY